MKPGFLSQKDFDRYMEEGRRALAVVLPGMPPSSPFAEIAAAGEWLTEQVKGAGGSTEDAGNLSSALGQACFPSRDPWATGEAMLKRWREGRAPKAGRAFAEELLDGDVSDLPPGGARITLGEALTQEEAPRGSAKPES